MGKNKDLTSDERSRIVALRQSGLSFREITEFVPRSVTAIRNCIVQFESGVKTARPGPKPILSVRARRAIIRAVPNRSITSRAVVGSLNLPCSARTVRRVIKASGVIAYRKRRRKPILSDTNRARRVVWARSRLNWNTRWRKIVFSDEKSSIWKVPMVSIVIITISASRSFCGINGTLVAVGSWYGRPLVGMERHLWRLSMAAWIPPYIKQPWRSICFPTVQELEVETGYFNTITHLFTRPVQLGPGWQQIIFPSYHGLRNRLT